MRVKSFLVTSLLTVALLSLALVAPAIYGADDYWSTDLSQKAKFYNKNPGSAKKIEIGPKNVNQLRSGNYSKKVESRIYDFRKGDVEVFWVLGSLWGDKGYVTAKITTTRGTETNYEFYTYRRRTGSGGYAQTKDTMPSVKGRSEPKIDHLLLIKRKMKGGYVYNPSESVITKVTFTYHP